ncbi:hypothetical protein [Sporosarcina sp. ITBMC105]
MSRKYNVKTTAVINGHAVGSTITLDADTAERLAAIKYVELLDEVKPEKPAAKADEKGKSAPKKSAKAPAKKKDK